MTLPTALSKTPGVNFFVKYFGANIVEFLADADLALKIESMSLPRQADFLLKELEKTFPGVAKAYNGKITASSWSHDQYFKGAYSRATIGGVAARTMLRKSIDGKLYFAGESLALGGQHSSLHGAYSSGIASANAVLQRMRGAVV
jgi:monoamine oxidase